MTHVTNPLGRLLFVCLLGISLLFSAPAAAQATTVYTEAWRIFKQAEADYSEELLAKAQREYEEVIEMLLPIQTPDAEQLRVRAELNRAKIAVRLDKIEGEKLILDFVRRYQPDPVANDALLEIANFYFNDGDLKKATEYYKRVPADLLTVDQRAELNFRLGYSAFVQKKFPEAKRYFQFSKSNPGEFYYPTNYYLGMIYFFEGNYDSALSQFRIAEKDKAYQPYIPYYLTQIFFAQRRYDELIAYAKPLAGSTRNRNQKEINQLLGQAYFEKKDYPSALPLFEAYARNNRRMQPEELYQLGFTQYKLGQYQEAGETFRELALENSLVGQSASYYLGDVLLRQGDGNSARNAFGTASRQTFSPEIQEEALFNYAKLSYELGFPADASAAIAKIQPQSRYYVQSQELLGKIFSSNQDFQASLDILSAMPNRTPQLQKAYQRAALGRAVELLRGGNLQGARTLLDQSLTQPIDPSLRAQAIYWKADIEHSLGNYPQSINLTNQFLALANGLQGLPAQSSVYTGNYLQGYNYLKQNNYPGALDYFVKTVEGIERNINFITDADVRERVLGDAVLRAGDAHFSRNQYDQAARYYDDAINRRTNGYVYAIYQKAVIEGLRNRNADKIIALEQLIQRYPNNEYADDALFQLAQTYSDVGQPQQALAPLRRIVSEYKQKSNFVNPALLQLGLLSYNLGNSEASINYYKQVFSNNPSAQEAEVAKRALEEIYVTNMGRDDLYLDFLSTIPGQELDADGREALAYKAAVSQYDNGNYDRAIPALTNYLRQYPRSPNALAARFYRADSYLAQRQYSQALPDYEAVVNAGISNFYLPAVKKAATIAYNFEKEFARSYQLYVQYERAAEADDDIVEAQVGALRSAYRLNDVAATEAYAAKVANNPTAPQQQRTTASFYLGKIAYDRQDYATARRAFQQVFTNSDDAQAAEARYLNANSYYLSRDYQTAERLINEANLASSEYPYWVAKTVILLSDVYRAEGDLLNAKAVLDAILEKYDGDAEVVAEARAKLRSLEEQSNQQSRLNTQQAPGTREGYLELDNSQN